MNQNSTNDSLHIGNEPIPFKASNANQPQNPQSHSQQPANEPQNHTQTNGGGEAEILEHIRQNQQAFDNLANELKQPKQQYTTAQQTEPQPQAEPEPAEPTEADLDKERQKNAERIARAVDNLASLVMSLVAGEEDSSLFQAKVAQKNAIIEDLHDGMTEANVSVSIPWWANLVIDVPAAYVPGVRKAIKMKKQRKAIEAQRIQQMRRQQQQAQNTDPQAPDPTQTYDYYSPPHTNDPVTDIWPAPPEKKNDNINQPTQQPPQKNAAKPTGKECLYCGQPLGKRQKKFCCREHNTKYQAMKNKGKV